MEYCMEIIAVLISYTVSMIYYLVYVQINAIILVKMLENPLKSEKEKHKLLGIDSWTRKHVKSEI